MDIYTPPQTPAYPVTTIVSGCGVQELSKIHSNMGNAIDAEVYLIATAQHKDIAPSGEVLLLVLNRILDPQQQRRLPLIQLTHRVELE